MSDSTQNPPEEPAGTAPPPPGYQPAPPAGPAPTGIGQPADLMMRFLARLIDYVILVVVVTVIVITVVIGAIMGSSVGAFGTGGTYVAGLVSAIVGAAIYLGYFALLEARNGQTVGKMVLKLQTQGPDGSTPTLEQAVKRNIWTAFGLLGIIPIVGGLVGTLGQLVAMIMIAVTISNSATKQGWHDDFAGGTKVVKIG